MAEPYWNAENFPIASIVRNPCGTRSFRSGSWRILKPVIEREKCNNCCRCETFCSDGAISKSEGEEVESDYRYCKGCGIYANECPTQAIQMVLEAEEVYKQKIQCVISGNRAVAKVVKLADVKAN